MTVNLLVVTAQPSGVSFTVRVDVRVADFAAVAEAIDSFAFGRCGTCGFDVEDHIATVDPDEKPFLFCEKGDD